MNPRRAVAHWFRSRLARWEGPNRPESFELCCQTLTIRHTQIGFLVWFVGCLGWWPTDAYVYADNPLARATLDFTRPTLGALCIAMFMVLAWQARRPRAAHATMAAMGTVHLVILGVCV